MPHPAWALYFLQSYILRAAHETDARHDDRATCEAGYGGPVPSRRLLDSSYRTAYQIESEHNYASVDYLRLPQRSNYEHHDERLHSRYWQVDEIWTYCGKKQRRARKEDGPDVADQWVFVAIGEETKVVPAFHVGKRYRKDTREFMWNLYARISNRVQITTDGLVHYIRLRLPMLLDSMLISPSS